MNMNKYLLLYALAVTLLLAGGIRRYRTENRRLEQNQHALLSQVEHHAPYQNAARRTQQ